MLHLAYTQETGHMQTGGAFQDLRGSTTGLAGLTVCGYAGKPAHPSRLLSVSSVPSVLSIGLKTQPERLEERTLLT